MQRLYDKKPIIIFFLVSYEVSWQTMWIQISQLLKELADQALTVYRAAYVLLHGFLDMIVTFFHM